MIHVAIAWGSYDHAEHALKQVAQEEDFAPTVFIHDMADASRRILQLRPVTFRYTQTFADGSKPRQFGLIAEEVAEVFPELAVRNADGVVETVHYETLSVLLVNELQRQERRIEMLEQRLNELAAR